MCTICILCVWLYPTPSFTFYGPNYQQGIMISFALYIFSQQVHTSSVSYIYVYPPPSVLYLLKS